MSDFHPGNPVDECPQCARYEVALREILEVRQHAREAVRGGVGEYLTPWHAGEMASIAEEALAAAQEGK